MSDMKTVKNKKSVTEFLNSVTDDRQKKDTKKLLAIFKKATGKKPVMWGPSIVGFGEYSYKRKDGSEHEFLMTGFSPRKQNLTVYIMPGFKEYQSLMKKLGKYKTSVSCLYFKTLEDVDEHTLETLIKKSFMYMQKKYR